MAKKHVRAIEKRLKSQSLRGLAREIPCSPSYLCDVIHGRREAGPKIVEYLARSSRSTGA
jgi:hypothetical protein